MNKLLLTLLALSLIVASCSKSKNEPDEKDKTCKVIVVEHLYTDGDAFNDKYFYTYDSSERITRVSYGTEQSTQYEIYTYANNTFTWKGVENVTPQVFTVDANGRVTEAILPYETKPVNFKYNNDGNLLEIESNGYREAFSYNNGNLTSVTTDSKPWATFVYSTIDNNNDLVYSLIYRVKYLDFDEISFRVLPIGKKSKNLPSKIVTYGGTVFQVTYDYTYETNVNGNVTSIKVKESNVHGGYLNEEYRLTYECK